MVNQVLLFFDFYSGEIVGSSPKNELWEITKIALGSLFSLGIAAFVYWLNKKKEEKKDSIQEEKQKAKDTIQEEKIRNKEKHILI
jgi:hypothetical protein